MRHIVMVAAFCALLSSLRAAETDSVYIGRVDTVGITTYDRMLNGPSVRRLVNSTEHGLHLAWMYSASDRTTFPDRNMRYAFYDYDTRTWGLATDVFTERSGCGNLDADPVTGVAIVSAHMGVPLHPELARDMAPGAGIFEYCTGCPVVDSFLWPVIATGANRWIHVGIIDDATRDELWYSRVRTWCNWDSAVSIAVPSYPDQNIAASKVSDKVCLTWVDMESDSQRPAYYIESTDSGTNWGRIVQLPYPSGFGGDTLTTFTGHSLFPFYDSHDRLRIVASVIPVVAGTVYICPAAIWHWCRDNNPEWSEIHRAGGSHLAAALGYGATYASRPTIGEDSEGDLYVAWEQFDSLNVEPGPPERLRAGIWSAGSDDNGMTWSPAIRLTPLNTVSHRFPCIVDQMVAGAPDTVVVTYLMDLTAGFFVMGEGPADLCPIACQFVPENLLGVYEERGAQHVQRLTPSATIVRGVLHVGQDGRMKDEGGAVLLDITGRKVAVLQPGANDIRHLAPGVYVAKLESGTRKLVLQH